MSPMDYKMLIDSAVGIGIGFAIGELVVTGILYSFGNSDSSREAYTLGYVVRNPDKGESAFFKCTAYPARWLLRHF